MLNERAQVLLKNLIERYIADGQPVASRALTGVAGLSCSPATIRNVMADLESMGLLVSPHTSAGRVPTARGYRVFVDQLITLSPLAADAREQIASELQPDSPQRMAAAASQLLSDLTRFAGVVLMPTKAERAFRHIEFLRLSERRVLLILVTTEGDVQNHLLQTARDYQAAELFEAAQFLNEHYVGQNLDYIGRQIEAELHHLRENIADLMALVIQAGRSDLHSDAQEIVVAGKSRLLNVAELSNNLNVLRGLFDMFERKTELLQLLKESHGAQGVHVFIGEESGVHRSLDGCSVVTAAYHRDGHILGSLGVIGPTRMNYDKVIPTVEITAQLLSNALSVNAA